jgi:hypothetical protein
MAFNLIAGPLNDMHVFDPASMTWTDLSNNMIGELPPARRFPGFTSAGGRLFVLGGSTMFNGECLNQRPESPRTFWGIQHFWAWFTADCTQAHVKLFIDLG